MALPTEAVTANTNEVAAVENVETVAGEWREHERYDDHRREEERFVITLVRFRRRRPGSANSINQTPPRT
jgi:hypothetical protein